MYVYDTDAPKTAHERELEATVLRLDARLKAAREGSAEHKLILRQLDSIRRDSCVGRLIMEEYDAGQTSHFG